jgi:chromosomal replication initiation ATPase DnaA
MLVADLILEITAGATGISVRQMKSDSQDKDISDARKMAVALMMNYKVTNASIARALKYTSRSSVNKAIDQHRIMVQNEAENYSYVMTFKKAQVCTKRALDMLNEDVTKSTSSIVETILKMC